MTKKRDMRHVDTEENWITGSLNFVVFLAIAAVAYTDWMVVPNISLGYLYVLPIALSALINPLPLTIGLAVGSTFLRTSSPERRIRLRSGLFVMRCAWPVF